jgi:hypothetical protein
MAKTTFEEEEEESLYLQITRLYPVQPQLRPFAEHCTVTVPAVLQTFGFSQNSVLLQRC